MLEERGLARPYPELLVAMYDGPKPGHRHFESAPNHRGGTVDLDEAVEG